MKVFIANFGRENYEWPECLARGTIATMNDVPLQRLWEANDRESYIRESMTKKTAAGISPTRPVASRWFNLMTIIARSEGDVWIHREKDQLWWTVSRTAPPSFELKREPIGDKHEVVVCHKTCERWNNEDKKGSQLLWNALHPKAREFLFTEGTLQQLSQDHADYALALIEGADLITWHSVSEWRAKEGAVKHSAATIFSAKQRAAARMAYTVEGTVANANGQTVLQTVKNKESRFSSRAELEKYLVDLIDLQDGLCIMTGLRLQFDGEETDKEMLCSLDRIDSDGHYEVGNLQVVCRFINRWKGNSDNADFKRLIHIVKSIDAAT
jgi:hypothetical protein